MSSIIADKGVLRRVLLQAASFLFPLIIIIFASVSDSEEAVAQRGRRFRHC